MINPSEGLWGQKREPVQILRADLPDGFDSLSRNLVRHLAKIVAMICGQQAVHITVADRPEDVPFDPAFCPSSLALLGFGPRTQAIVDALGLTTRLGTDEGLILTQPSVGTSDFWTREQFDSRFASTETEYTEQSECGLDADPIPTDAARYEEDRELVYVRRVSPVLHDVSKLHCELGTTWFFHHLKLRKRLTGNLTGDVAVWLRAILEGHPEDLPIAVSVAPVVLTSDDFVLLARRSARMPFAPRAWCPTLEEIMVPADGTIFDALIRGIREELGCTVVESSLRLIAIIFNAATAAFDFEAIARISETWRAVKAGFEGRITKRVDQELTALDAFPVGQKQEETLWTLCQQLCSESYEASDKAARLEPHSLAEPWHPTARLRLYQFLACMYGRGFTDGALCRSSYEKRDGTI